MEKSEKIIVEYLPTNEEGTVLSWDTGNGPHGSSVIVERSSHTIGVWPVIDCKVVHKK